MFLDASSFGIRYYESPIELVDTSVDQDSEDLNQLLNESSIIIIIYDLHQPNSFEKVKDLYSSIPKGDKLYRIIIVGNKYDLLDANSKKFIVDNDKTELEILKTDVYV